MVTTHNEKCKELSELVLHIILSALYIKKGVLHVKKNVKTFQNNILSMVMKCVKHIQFFHTHSGTIITHFHEKCVLQVAHS